MKIFAKRLTSTLLVLMLAVTAFPNSVFAAEEIEVHEHSSEIAETATSGVIGDSSVEWNLDTASGRMVFTGSGDCEPFTSADDQPWVAVREQITEVWFYDMDALNISELAYWFDGCSSLVTAEIPYTTPVIGTRAFADCPALETIMLYHVEEPLAISQNAFTISEPTMLEVRYVTSSDSTLETLSSYNWHNDNRFAYYTDVYGIMTLATSTCNSCGVTCSYTLDYEEWSDTYHTVRWWCSNCGDDMNQGTNAGVHRMSGGECTLCGYEETCYHDDSYTEWDDCDWYEYCSDCDELLDEGTEHGDYEYDDWEYYTSSRHRRYYYCEDCGGDDGYEYDYHDADTEYYKYDSTRHEVTEYCYDCDSDIDSYYEDHSFSYGSWANYSSSQHRRSVSCYDCGYSGYEYGGHSLSYGSWSSYSSTQHRRTVTCSTCGYSSYEYANHTLITGSWKSASASQHSRTISCSCGYSTTETASHSLSYGAWTNYSATQHKRTISCSTCGYSTTEYASHSLATGSWSSISDTEHSRTTSCSCGYSYNETENHNFTYGTWTSISDSQHERSVTCDCGYSGTEYADHDLVTSDWMEFSESQHFRTISCDCGYSLDEYADHTDTDNDGGCDDCTYITSRFSVTVPAFMTMVVSNAGEVYAATNAEIINNSTAAIAVTDITITTDNGWTLVPYNTDMANEKVDSRQIGFMLNGTDGFDGILSNDTRLKNEMWTAEKDSFIPLSYDAVVSATSEILTDEQVLTVIFVISWAA